jgi:hypothetical protein
MVRKLKVAEAASIMGVHPSALRYYILNSMVPFGFAVKKSSEYTYYINAAQFCEYAKITMDELERMIK